MPVAEAVLGERIREGDAEAFGQLYEEHAPGVYDFLVRLVRDRSAAEDLTQSTFTRAFEQRASLRDPSKVRSWLWSTAHNLAMNHLGRTRRSESIDDQVDLAETSRGPEESAMAHDAAELVWLAAASLEPRQYAVLDLTVRRDLSTQEVADTLRVPVAHAAVLVHRAREALGNAVRYLLVARRRDACGQLAALVPAGVRALTPEQRSAVDHHMRRCATCRELGERLTAPVELLGGLVLIPLPARLAKLDWSRMVAGTGTRAASGVPGRAVRHVGRRAGRHAAQAGQHATIGITQVVLAALVTVAIAAPAAGSTAAPGTASAIALAASSGSAAVQPATFSSSGNPTTGGGSPASTRPVAVVVSLSPYDASFPLSSIRRTNQATVLKLLTPDGRELNTLTLIAGAQLVGVGGPRVVVLEAGGVLKGVRSDGAVEQLGNLGAGVGQVVLSPDGTRWLWNTTDNPAPNPGTTVRSEIHLGGIGLTPRVVETASSTVAHLVPVQWTAGGAVIVHQAIGLGGRFLFPYPGGPIDVLDPDTGSVRAVSQTNRCTFWDLKADGTVACLGGSGILGASRKLELDLISSSGHVGSFGLPSDRFPDQAGLTFFAPSGSALTVVARQGPDANGQISQDTYLFNTSDGSLTRFGPAGYAPAIGAASWLPDGSLVVTTLPGGLGTPPGAYLVSPTGVLTTLSSTGYPVGVIEPSGTQLPDAYAGTWTGTMNQPDYSPSNYSMTITLRSAALGADIGEASYRSLACSSVLTLQSASTELVTVSEHITSGPCLDGVMDLRLNGRAIAVVWRDTAGTQRSTATLVRTP